MTITLKKDRITKNTIRFSEVTDSDLDTPVLGTIYVSKAALKTLDYKDDDMIVLELSVKGS